MNFVLLHILKQTIPHIILSFLHLSIFIRTFVAV